MIVDDLRERETARGWERSARFRWAGGELRLAIDASEELATRGDDGSPFLAIGLLVAMIRREDLDVEPPVSPRLLASCETIEDTYIAWAPALHRAEVRASAAAPPLAPSPSPGRGCFFSRGVDSMYSAARRREPPLTHLVHAEGLEPKHGERVRAEEVRLAGEAAAICDLPLTTVWTNVRELTDRVAMDWEDAVGPGLAFVALSLAGGLGCVAIPPTDSAITIAPSGTSPLLDPLFSTERVEIEHDISPLGREAKLARLARDVPAILPYLKVCFGEDRADNCGRCGKCLATMVALRGVGVLHRVDGFPDEIDPAVVRGLKMGTLHELLDWVEAARALDPVRDAELRSAALEAVERSAARLRARDVRDLSERPTTPDFRRRHTNAAIALIQAGRPHPPVEGLAGLVRALDRDAGRHVYGVGSVPADELVGELGALHTEPLENGMPVWLTDDGRLFSPRYRPELTSSPRKVRARWVLAPLAWRGFESLPRRARASAARAFGSRDDNGHLPHPTEGRPDAAPAGYLHSEGSAGRLPLYSSVHPVTGDQLLSTSPWEALDCGYSEPAVLGWLEPAAPATGRLGTDLPRLPWASRFGQRVRDA